MKYLKKIIKLNIPLLIVLIASCLKTDKIIISKLHPYEEVDSMGQKYKYYVVQNFEVGNKQQFNQLKKFANQNVDSNYNEFEGYSISFFKESNKTPIKFVQTESDLILWHNEDLVCTFEWKYGRFLNYYEYKKGRIIEKGKN